MLITKLKMFTCSRCSFQHPLVWAMNEHMYVKHDFSSLIHVVLGEKDKSVGAHHIIQTSLVVFCMKQLLI